MKKAFDWFVVSSQNPQKLSLTLKSLAAFAVLFGVDSAIVDEGIGHFVNLIASLGMLATTITAIYGFVRKFKVK